MKKKATKITGKNKEESREMRAIALNMELNESFIGIEDEFLHLKEFIENGFIDYDHKMEFAVKMCHMVSDLVCAKPKKAMKKLLQQYLETGEWE